MTQSPPIEAPSPLRVMLVDDHPVFRYGLAQMLSQAGDFVVCAEASNAQTALQMMREHSPDLAIVDIALPGPNGIELVKSMTAEKPDLRILMLSLHDESVFALRALRAGARGYLMKEEAVDWVMKALSAVASGKLFISAKLNQRLIFRLVHGDQSEAENPVELLSDRELEILHCLGRGGTTRSIAAQLSLSIKTVETHRNHAKQKLGLKDQEELVKFAAEWSAANET
jgi:DNA-binding NarL/FixJ family response regulator